MSGLKVVGCCVHVATVICFLSNFKYKSLKLPGEHLNSIFVNLKLFESANQPRYVRSKRSIHINQSSSSSETDTESSSDSANDTETESSINSASDIDIENSSNSEIGLINENEKKSLKSSLLNQSTTDDLNQYENIQSNQNYNEHNEDDIIIGDIVENDNLFPIPTPLPHDLNKPIELELTWEQLRNGEWLTDIEINAYMRLLKTEFPHINGLEMTNYFTNDRFFVPNKTRDWVRILYSNNHWTCLASGINNDDDISVFDSMSRKNVEETLGDQVARMLPTTIIEQPVIRFIVKKTQKQKRTLCGYFACAYATAICNRIDIEEIYFEEKNVIEHYINCINNKKTSMFPFFRKTRVNKTKSVIIEYKRRNY